MPYVPTVWKNREVERPRTYIQQDNGDGTITLIPAEGTVIEPGTPIIASNMNNIEQGIARAHEAIADTGWINLTLKNGIEKYSNEETPQYRKKGQTVFLRGAVKGVTNGNTVIGTLPSDCRPSALHPFVQNTSAGTDGTAYFSRLRVNTNGDIVVENSNRTFSADRWIPISTVFATD